MTPKTPTTTTPQAVKAPASVPQYGSFSSSGQPSGAGAPAAPVPASDLPSDLAGRSYQFDASGSQAQGTLSQTGQLLQFLRDVETGKMVSIQPNSIGATVAQQAGLGRHTGPLSRAQTNKLRQAAIGAVKKSLKQLGINPGRANTSTEFNKLVVSGSAKARLSQQGYTVDKVSSLGSLLSEAPKQQPTATTNDTGAAIYANFSNELSNNSSFASQMVSEMNQAGLSEQTLDVNNPGATLNAFQKLLGETPAGQDPFKVLADKVGEIQQGGIQPGSKPDSAYSYVAGVANQIGFPLDDNELNAIAAEYPDAGSSTADDEAIRQAVARVGAQSWSYDPNNPPQGGSYLAEVVNAVQDTAGQYAMPMSNDVLTKIAQDTLEHGDLSSIYAAKDAAQANAELHAKALTSQLYPAMAPLISQGYTVQDIMDPYKQATANLLGKSAADINLEDPEFAQLMKSPEGGMPSIDQWKATVMQDPRFNWQNSQDAAIKYSNLAQTLVSTFGKVGGGPTPYSASVPSSTAG